MPESRREKPTRFDFLDSAEFEEKVDKYASVSFPSFILENHSTLGNLGDLEQSAKTDRRRSPRVCQEWT